MKLQAVMQDSALSRRSVLRGFSLVGAAFSATVPGNAASPPLPTLRSGRHQFVEFEPAEVVPDYQLRHLNGSRQSLHAFRGRVVIVNIWATWCPPCREELPILEALTNRAEQRGPIAIAISIDREASAVVKPYLTKLGIRRLPVFLDPDFKIARRANEATSQDPFRLFGLPISYVLSPGLRNLGYIDGLVDWTSPDAERLLTAAGSR